MTGLSTNHRTFSWTESRDWSINERRVLKQMSPNGSVQCNTNCAVAKYNCAVEILKWWSSEKGRREGKVDFECWCLCERNPGDIILLIRKWKYCLCFGKCGLNNKKRSSPFWWTKILNLSKTNFDSSPIILRSQAFAPKMAHMVIHFPWGRPTYALIVAVRCSAN